MSRTRQRRNAIGSCKVSKTLQNIVNVYDGRSVIPLFSKVLLNA